MEIAQAPPPVRQELLSEQERLYLKVTEEAIRDGVQLERWCRDPRRRINQFPLQIYRPFKKPFALENKAFGYFSNVQIQGQTLPAVGIVQEVRLSKLCPSVPEEKLVEFVLGKFMSVAHWTYADGYPGGFTIEPMLYRTSKGEYGKIPPTAQTGCVDWRELGKEYDWVLVTIRLYDFVMNIGPWLKRLKEAVAVVLLPDFVHVVKNPAPGFKLEVAVGYPVTAFAPIPNFFGFGPGKFDWAVKLFSFLLTDNNEVFMNMDFVAGRRPAKVFDFGKHIPDPVYGGAALLHALTLGLWSKDKFHDKMDGEMARQHGRVHQALADGVAKVWETWVRDGCPK